MDQGHGIPTKDRAMNGKLSTDQVNYLNIVLMGLSAFLAFRFPFELFLFAYAVLGPLHYLTEISWLHDRGYYTRGKYDFLVLLAACAVITLLYFGWISGAPKGSSEYLTCFAFFCALGFVLFKGLTARLLGVGAGALTAFFLSGAPLYQPIFGVLIPTLIHVFLFTAMFILVGALKGRNFSGVLSLLVFLALALSFVFVHPSYGNYHPSDYVRDSYGLFKAGDPGTGRFISLNYTICQIFGLHSFGAPTQPFQDYLDAINGFLYDNPLALSLMAFIAFAYTYHYLNWFSKTSIIGWHQIPRSRAAAILVLWGLSLALYAYNYALGFRWLLFLSLAHVLLEFPLDQLTFINIAKELGGLWKPRKA